MPLWYALSIAWNILSAVAFVILAVFTYKYGREVREIVKEYREMRDEARKERDLYIAQRLTEEESEDQD